MILQLNPAILVNTPLGQGQAIFIIDYGMHQNTCWVVALSESGIVKHFDCNDVILATNYTYGINDHRHDKKYEEEKHQKEEAPKKIIKMR